MKAAPLACAASMCALRSWMQPLVLGYLRDHGEAVVVLQQRRRDADQHLQAERLGARADHLDRLRMAVAGHDDGVALALDAALGQRHRLGRRRGFVEHRGVGDGHAREVAHHGLEVDQGFHAALRDLRLVRRVGRVPGRVLEDVALDDAGRERAVVALADEALADLVLLPPVRPARPAHVLRSPPAAAPSAAGARWRPAARRRSAPGARPHR